MVFAIDNFCCESEEICHKSRRKCYFLHFKAELCLVQSDYMREIPKNQESQTNFDVRIVEGPKFGGTAIWAMAKMIKRGYLKVIQ